MATVTGAMSTTNILSDQAAIDLGDMIKLLEPDAAPLTQFSRRASKRRTTATKFSWIEDQSKARFDDINGTTGTGTSITVDNGAYFQQWDQVLVTRTGEQLRVDAVAGNVLTVTRGIGGSAVAVADNDELLIIGSAQPEGDTSKPARSDIPSKVTNHTQIFRTPFEITGSAMAIGYQVSPAEWPRQARMKGIEHAKDLEYSFLLGKKSATTPGATEDRTTGGALSFITTNSTAAGGDLTEAEFNSAMATAMRYGQSRKLALASSTGVSSLNKFPASKQQTTNNEKTYGMDVTTYTSPFGSIQLVYHRLLEGDLYGGYIIILDMEQVAYRYLANDQHNRDTKVLQNRQENDRDGRKDEYLSECGLEFGLQRTHAVITGITS